MSSFQDDATAQAIPGPGPLTPTATAVRTFMFGTASDEGPKLLAFRVSNLLIGRLADNHLGLNHSSVSRRHARISVMPNGVFIEDLGSQNGSTINGNTVNGRQPIRPGDILRIGHVPLFYFGFVQLEDPPKMQFVENSILLTPIVPPI